MTMDHRTTFKSLLIVMNRKVQVSTWHSTMDAFFVALCDILGFYEAQDNIVCV